jgi:DNA-binding transcriptional regulator YhcF (GntR family)
MQRILRMNLHLDRSLPISLTEQIKGQIIYSIVYGFLQVGEPLPSVRDLSARLKVAPMTVSQVYRQLAKDGLVVTRPGVGTFVADITSPAGAECLEGQTTLYQAVDTCVRQALLLGHTLDEVRAAFLARLEQQGSERAARLIWMVGNFTPATDAYAREIETLLRDLNVCVEPVLLNDLPVSDGKWLGNMQHPMLVITVPPRLQEVRSRLDGTGCPVAAVAFRVSSETRRALAAISPDSRVGIVSTYPSFLQSLLDVVTSYGMYHTTPVSALVSQEDRVRELLAKVDVAIYATGSEAILEQLPAGVQAIEYRHTPEPDSVNRLRPLIA